jgi:hypothetical protein
MFNDLKEKLDASFAAMESIQVEEDILTFEQFIHNNK